MYQCSKVFKMLVQKYMKKKKRQKAQLEGEEVNKIFET